MEAMTPFCLHDTGVAKRFLVKGRTVKEKDEWLDALLYQKGLGMHVLWPNVY